MLQIKNEYTSVCWCECVGGWVKEQHCSAFSLFESIQQLHNTPPLEWDSLTLKVFMHRDFYLMPMGIESLDYSYLIFTI